MLIWGIVVVGTSDNIVRPWIVSARRPLHPLLILIVILGGVQAFGLMGLLIGPVTLAVMLALLRILKEEINPVAAARESGGSPLAEEVGTRSAKMQ